MLKNIVALFMLVLCLPVMANQDPLGVLIKNLEGKEKLVSYVMKKTADKKMTREKAVEYVNAAALASANHGVKISSIMAMTQQESTFRSKAISGYKAVGYMQVVPRFHQVRIKGRNIWNPEVNLDVGTQYLKECGYTVKTDLSLVFSCYSGFPPKQSMARYGAHVVRYKREVEDALQKEV